MAEARSLDKRLSLRLGLAIVAVEVLLALAAPFLAPHPPDRQYDPGGAAERPPGTVLIAVARVQGGLWLVDRAELTAGGLLVERRGRRHLLPREEVTNLGPAGVEDRLSFPLGTDRYGRDLLSRLLYGGRVSLAVAVLAVALALTLGVALGALAAAGGPLVDNLVMRLVDALLAFPILFLLLAIAALLRPSNALLILVLGGTGWMGISRLTRGGMISTREQSYVTAARGLGLPPWRIVLRHILPNAMAPVLATAALLVGSVILAESALSFLGLGIQPPQASWGNLISDGRDSLTSAWWVSAFPGLAISLAVIGFNLIGDGLRDLLDPQLQAVAAPASRSRPGASKA